MAGRRRRRRRRKRRKRLQKGGASLRRAGSVQLRGASIQDQIAEGAAMFLSGPKPTFSSLGLLLGKQAAKGVKDNVEAYIRR